jgi:hypothetical protein
MDDMRQACEIPSGRLTGLPRSGLYFPAPHRHCPVGADAASSKRKGQLAWPASLMARRSHDQTFGGKNTRVRTSMLSLGGASAGASGFSNEVWNDNLARPSLALSWTRIRITSSGCCSEK